VSLNENLLAASPPWASKTSRSSISASSTHSTPSPRAALASYRGSTASHTLRNPSLDSTYHNPPCATLYIRNLPTNPSEISLHALFSSMPGYKGLRMKLTKPECFVQFNDVISASNALHKLDDYRFHAEDTWGIRVCYARNVPRSGQMILTIEEEECVLPEVYVPEPLLQMEQLNSEVEVPSPATSRRGRFAQLLTPGRSASRRRSVSSLSEGNSRRDSVPPVPVVDKKEEKRKKKEQKKKEREKERQMMGTTDHNVRWGP
jgi:hypothetical protein